MIYLVFAGRAYYPGEGFEDLCIATPNEVRARRLYDNLRMVSYERDWKVLYSIDAEGTTTELAREDV